MDVLWICLIVCGYGGMLSVSSKEEQDRNIYRPHLGVVLEHVGSIVPSTNHWYHSFVVELPDYEELMQMVLGDDDSVHVASPFKESMQNLKYEISRVEEFAKRRFHQLNLNSANSTRRTAPQQYIAPLFTSLFGAVKFDDIKKVAAKVNRMIRRGHRLDSSLIAHEEHSESYMSLKNPHVDNLARALKHTYKAFGVMEEDTKSYRDMMSLELAVLRNNTKAMFLLSETSKLASHFLMDLERSIEDISVGILPSQLLPSETLGEVLSHIEQKQRASGSPFRLLHMDPLYYYKHGSYVASMVNRDIWITLKMQVGLDKKFDLYQVKVLNIPAGKHSTAIRDLPDYVMISANGMYLQELSIADISANGMYLQELSIADISANGMYLQELSIADMNKCSGGPRVRVCSFADSSVLLEKPDSCIAALLLNNASRINEVCDLRLARYGNHQTLVHVTENKVLVVDVPELELSCLDGATRVLRGCDFCLVELPCNCQIRAPNMAIITPPARICTRHSDSTPTCVHLSNFHVLIEYMRGANELNTSELFHHNSSKIDAIWKSFNRDISDVLREDSERTVRLNELAERAKQIRLKTKKSTETDFIQYIQISALFGGTLGLVILVISILLMARKVRKLEKLQKVQFYELNYHIRRIEYKNDYSPISHDKFNITDSSS